MFCEKCGNTVNPGERFCNKCGAPVYDTYNENSKKKAGGTVVILIAVLVVLFVILIIGGILLFTQTRRVIDSGRSPINIEDKKWRAGGDSAMATSDYWSLSQSAKSQIEEEIANSLTLEYRVSQGEILARITAGYDPTSEVEYDAYRETNGYVEFLRTGTARIEIIDENNAKFLGFDNTRSSSGFGGNASASSVLSPQEGNSYSPSNVLDKNSSTAWIEAVGGKGIGESITITFNTTESPKGARIKSGYHKDYETFTKNSTPVKYRFEFSDGTVMEPLEYGNLFIEGSIDFSSGAMFRGNPAAVGAFGSNQAGMCDIIVFPEGIETTYVKITILDVASGTKWEDTAISEVEFY